MKRGQISTEVMYAIGTMLIVFLILSGISFVRKSDLGRLTNFLDKKNECIKIANILNTIWSSGDNFEAVVNFKYNTSIFSSGLVFVADNNIGPKTIEATCTFNGNIQTFTSLKGNYNITYDSGNITITQ